MSYAAAPALPRHRVVTRRPAVLRPVVIAAVVLGVVGLTVALPGRHADPSTGPTRASAPAASSAAAASLLRGLPLAAQLTISRTVGADRAGYGLRATADGAAGATPAQRLTERFDRAGVTVAAGGHRLGLTLRTLAGGGATVAVPAASPTVRANRVSYARGPVTEWYDNGPLGLEQSFRVAAAPAAGGRTLTLGLALNGNTLAARPAGHDLALVDARGATVLRYRGLVAHDARGHALAARMRATRDGISLAVTTAGARYPVTVDPVVQQGRLTASDGIAYQHLGSSVAISGDTIALGSPDAKVAGNLQGAVYVFTKPAGGWGTGTQVGKLYASNAGVGGGSNVYGDTLGASVAISGDTIVAGAPRATVGDPMTGQTYAGKAYVFVKPPGGWAPAAFQTAELVAGDATQFDNNGSSVATDGTTIVVGAPRAGSLEYGAAYVYTKPGGGWVSATENARLTASDGASGAGYAYSVAVAGSTVAVGYPYTQSGLGAVYTYKKPDAGGWANATQTARLTSSPQVVNESLGASIAMEGTTLVAGAPNNYNPGSAVSSVYVFEQPGGGWTGGTVTSSVRLTQTDATAADHFGGSVAISGATITAASAYTPGTGAGRSGGVYVFARSGATWASTNASTKISAADGGVEQADTAAVSGTSVVMSAKYAKVGTTTEQGAAYVFDTNGAPGGGDTTPAPTPTTTPDPTPAAPPPTAVLQNFVPVPTRVPNDIGWGDVAANLLGIVPGSGATSDWGQFVFIALCKQPDGCKGTITFGAQKPAPGAHPAAVAAKAKAKTAPPYGKVSFSLRKDQQRTLTVKLSAAARKLGREKHKLTGFVTISIKRPGTTPAVLSHALTLKVAPKKKAKKK